MNRFISSHHLQKHKLSVCDTITGYLSSKVFSVWSFFGTFASNNILQNQSEISKKLNKTFYLSHKSTCHVGLITHDCLKSQFPVSNPELCVFSERVLWLICLSSTGAFMVSWLHHQWPWWDSNPWPTDHAPQALPSEPRWLPKCRIDTFCNLLDLGMLDKTFILCQAVRTQVVYS